MTFHEAEAILNANPLTSDPQVKAAIVAVKGDAGFRQMRQEAGYRQGGNISVSTRQQHRPAPAAAASTPEPPPQNLGSDPTWEVRMQNIELELMRNPVGIARAEKDLLRTRWGKEEFNRRYQEALDRSGQLNMRVTVRPSPEEGADSQVREYEGRIKPTGSR